MSALIRNQNVEKADFDIKINMEDNQERKYMFWPRKKYDIRTTLVFNTKSGIKRSQPQNVSTEQTVSECIENLISEHSESGRLDTEGENVNG